jgi:hypothetical protein
LARREAENHLPLDLLSSSAPTVGRASQQLIRGVRALRQRPDTERWVLPLDSFFAKNRGKNHRWGSERCKKWLRELLLALETGTAELESDALEHLTDLLDELERWL